MIEMWFDEFHPLLVGGGAPLERVHLGLDSVSAHVRAGALRLRSGVFGHVGGLSIGAADVCLVWFLAKGSTVEGGHLRLDGRSLRASACRGRGFGMIVVATRQITRHRRSPCQYGHA
ncbi:hypothetical protein [Frankia sp. AgKG'84/4]|uniref:hypothetical protein n=1 Tax=Frankia sp. AgKG'84/4 TaxID=573490 RepID=UPI00200C4B2E|nr:hypothetical protein [Frankia sp. AgKG'84/4]MCL9793898.1 hypothetical protein [Frankia sp. AgKG'84/4]